MFDANVNDNEQVKAARRALAAELAKRGARVRFASLPVEADVNGPDDYLAKHGDEKLFGLLDKARPAGKRDTTAPRQQQGREVTFTTAEPWDEPVDGSVLVEQIAGIFRKYLVLPEHADLALALWVLHAYTLDAWFVSPMLAITSPVKRCGKTALVIILGALVPRALLASSVTAAVVFRVIEKYAPTFLIDEADTFIRDNDELRGILNSGHTRTTARVIRAVGDDHEPRAFSTWCAKAIALIGKLPGTLADRSIEIAMRRRMPSEQVARFRQDLIDAECGDLCRQASRWAEDHVDDLRAADPSVPAALHDRAADCWRPLLAIADAIGSDWPRKARDAAKVLSGAEADADQPLSILLLTDVRAVFDADGGADMTSQALVEALRALEDRPWATYGRTGKGLSPHSLARLLKDFKIVSTKQRFGGDGAPSKNGYSRALFEESWRRYAPTPGTGSEHGTEPTNTGANLQFSADPTRNGGDSCSESDSAKTADSANENGHLFRVPTWERGAKPAAARSAGPRRVRTTI